MICVLFLFCSLILSGSTAPDQPGYVTHYDNNTTAIVLIAHSNLDGAAFAELETGDVLLYFPRVYRVAEIIEAKATEPDSLSTSLEWDGVTHSPAEVYEEIFGREGLVLMTCMERDGNPRWGRLFVVAK